MAEKNLSLSERIGYEHRLMFDVGKFAELVAMKIGKDAAKQAIVDSKFAAVKSWSKSLAARDSAAGKPCDIQGIHDFLWSTLPELGFEFSFVDHSDSREYKITKCPWADFASENGIEDFVFAYHCMSDYPIVEGYNPNIEFTRTKTLMMGDDCCNHCYRMKS